MKATAPTAAGPILAIDRGRYKSVACAYDRATATARFHTLATGRADFERLFDRHPGALVVVEACANAGWAADLAAAHGLAVKVANTSGEAWRFTHLKRKTDRDDARRLAELEALGQLPTVALPGPAARQRRGLNAHRQALVGRRTAATAPGPRPAWPAWTSRPSRWPTAAPRSCGAGCSTWPWPITAASSP